MSEADADGLSVVDSVSETESVADTETLADSVSETLSEADVEADSTELDSSSDTDRDGGLEMVWVSVHTTSPRRWQMQPGS